MPGTLLQAEALLALTHYLLDGWSQPGFLPLALSAPLRDDSNTH